MSECVETGGKLEIRQNLRLVARLFLLVLSLVPLSAIYELLIKPKWQGYFNFIFIFCALVALGALAVSIFLVWAALLGLNTVIVFDKKTKMFAYTRSAPLLKPKETKYPLSSIKAVNEEIHHWTDGAPGYSLSVEMNDGRKFDAGYCWSKTEVQELSGRVRSFLAVSV